MVAVFGYLRRPDPCCFRCYTLKGNLCRLGKLTTALALLKLAEFKVADRVLDQGRNRGVGRTAPAAALR